MPKPAEGGIQNRLDRLGFVGCCRIHPPYRTLGYRGGKEFQVGAAVAWNMAREE